MEGYNEIFMQVKTIGAVLTDRVRTTIFRNGVTL